MVVRRRCRRYTRRDDVGVEKGPFNRAAILTAFVSKNSTPANEDLLLSCAEGSPHRSWLVGVCIALFVMIFFTGGLRRVDMARVLYPDILQADAHRVR
jgi:hypothetical protein